MCSRWFPGKVARWIKSASFRYKKVPTVLVGTSRRANRLGPISHTLNIPCPCHCLPGNFYFLVTIKDNSLLSLVKPIELLLLARQIRLLADLKEVNAQLQGDALNILLEISLQHFFHGGWSLKHAGWNPPWCSGMLRNWIDEFQFLIFPPNRKRDQDRLQQQPLWMMPAPIDAGTMTQQFPGPGRPATRFRLNGAIKSTWRKYTLIRL